MPMLYEATGLTKVFHRRTVLNLDWLQIKPQTITTISGPNGAGKTTLLNLLAFLDRPTTGTLQFQGKPVRYSQRQLVERRRQVVLIDQYPILFTNSVYNNIDFGLKIRGLSKKERAQRIDLALDLVDMKEFRQADARTLSGGETKRIALARALAIAPEVLLCDEPTANVDRKHRDIILEILQRIHQEQQTAIILVTHALNLHRLRPHQELLLENGELR